MLEKMLGMGRCASTPRRQLTYCDTTEVLGERVTFCVKADGLRKVGQQKIQHVPGSTQPTDGRTKYLPLFWWGDSENKSCLKVLQSEDVTCVI